MAKGRKTVSRLELRRQSEAAEAQETSGEAKPKTKRAAKTDGDAVPKVRKPAVRAKKKKKVEIIRLRRTWGVFDNNNQQVASFPYAERAAADQKLKELNEKGKTPFFMQPVNEPIVEPKPEGAEAAAKPVKAVK